MIRVIGEQLKTGRIFLLSVILSLNACVPHRHTLIDPEYPTARLATESQRAAQLCRSEIAASKMPLQSFTTDGCSFWPDQEWLSCCIEHDIAYWCGGSVEQRRRADRKLLRCVSDMGYPVIARLMKIGVCIGGHPWLPLPWRWGYGRNWPSGYDDPSEDSD